MTPGEDTEYVCVGCEVGYQGTFCELLVSLIYQWKLLVNENITTILHVFKAAFTLEY